jgi:superfamily I DNA/RNA helicase
MSFLPTAEQQAALDAFATGKNMVIEAGAGTGKTSTLRLLSESTTRKGIYIAYNKAIQTDAAAEFPENVQCKTAHSLAYGGVMRMPVGKALMNRLRGPRVPSRQAVAILGIPANGFQISDDQQIPAWYVASAAMSTVQRFCNSADDSITERHVPRQEGIEDHFAFAAYVAPFARKAWADLNDPKGKLNFAHDHYLKIWALSNPRLNCEFVLLDEAQDANPVIAQIVQNQTHAQQIMVGDRCQAIYGWRGAIDAMTTFEADHRLILSQSFRFGPAVAAEANIWLEKLSAPLRLSGFEQIESKVETLIDADAILCRTNAAVIEHAMSAQAQGKRVAIVGGTGEIKKFVEGAADLMTGRTANHPDLIAFNNWQEVKDYAASDEGRDLRVMVNLVTNYGVDAILSVCDASVNEDTADVIVSTAHKAKGREWNRVRIAADFKASTEEGEDPAPAEMMLLYVAVTRAKLVLDNTALYAGMEV